MIRDFNHDLSELIAGGEGATIEFKRSLTRELGRELCAFANASGGTVLVGVSDAGKIARGLGHHSVSAGFNRVMRRLLQYRLLEYTVPHKPHSRLQKYRIALARQAPIKGRANRARCPATHASVVAAPRPKTKP